MNPNKSRHGFIRFENLIRIESNRVGLIFKRFSANEIENFFLIGSECISIRNFRQEGQKEFRFSVEIDQLKNINPKDLLLIYCS